MLNTKNPTLENPLELMNNSLFYRLDWLTLLLYLALVVFGISNVYSTSFDSSHTGLFDLNTPAGKQVWFFIGCLVLLVPILFVKPNLFENLSTLIFIGAILSLIGLFIFGKTISGARSWYVFGGISIQPAEFAKIATALAIASRIGSFQTDLKKFASILKLTFIIALPTLLILLQPDAGSVLVFSGFIFVFIREGMDLRILWIGITMVLLFILTRLFSPYNLSIAIFIVIIVLIVLSKRKNKRTKIFPFLASFLLAVGFIFSSDYIFNTVFEQHHRDRFNILLGLETDTKGIGYNINQSKIAIGSGGFNGKGFLQGTQTKGKFVPEQHTDYIYSTIGEEWGFIGSSLVVFGFVFLIFRVIQKAEKQINTFRRVFSYAFASMLFVHFFVNIGMTLGLVPTVGIPLPFISYGGSNLIAFSLMLFVHLNLDAHRLNEW